MVMELLIMFAVIVMGPYGTRQAMKDVWQKGRHLVFVTTRAVACNRPSRFVQDLWTLATDPQTIISLKIVMLMECLTMFAVVLMVKVLIMEGYGIFHQAKI